MALKVLRELVNDHPEYELQTVDILTNPGDSWRAGVRMIPTVEAGGKKISGIILDKNKISTFLEEISSPT